MAGQDEPQNTARSAPQELARFLMLALLAMIDMIILTIAGSSVLMLAAGMFTRLERSQDDDDGPVIVEEETGY